MKKYIKYGLVPLATFVGLLITTVLALPLVINVQKYRPQIEDQLSYIAGRSVSIGSNLGISFFPSLSISFSDFRIDNPRGYVSAEFIKIESFEARIKLLPLLKKQVDISRFVISGLEVNLEKSIAGKGNWDFTRVIKKEEKPGRVFSRLAEWSVPEDLSMRLFVVTDGTVIWLDRTKDSRDSRYQLDDLMLVLHNFALDKPFITELKASAGGKSLSLEGTLAPLDSYAGKGASFSVDMNLIFLETFSGQLTGKIINLMENPSCDLKFHGDNFSAEEFFTALDLDSVMVNAAPATDRSVDFDFKLRGADGRFVIDPSPASFSISGSADLLDLLSMLMNKPNSVGNEAVIPLPAAVSEPFTSQKDSDTERLLQNQLKVSDGLDLKSLPVEDVAEMTTEAPADQAAALGVIRQQQYIGKKQAKKLLTVGTGRVRINPLQEKNSHFVQ